MLRVARRWTTALLGLSLAGCGAPLSDVSTVTPANPVGQACTLPSLPRAGTVPPGGLPYPMKGPALTSLTGGAVAHAFTLDGTGLVVAPPLAGERPTVSRADAECAALASLTAYNSPLVDFARQDGVAIGYGRVSVADSLLTKATVGPPGSVIPASGGLPVAPTVPVPSPYQHRLAWVLVFANLAGTSCPAFSDSGPPVSPARATDHNYLVFLLDSHGSDPLIYTEGGPSPCGFSTRVAPSVAVPLEQFSVPWRIASRNRDHYSATLAVTVLACYGYSKEVLVDPDAPEVQVVVQGPVDAACGPARQVPVTLHAATVTSDLPAVIAHAALGPYIPTATTVGQSVSPPPSAALPLRTLGAADNAASLTIAVGTVVVVPPLPGEGFATSSPVVSSDPAVLGTLGNGGPVGPLAEFRAWQPGHADLSVAPPGACGSSGANRTGSCTKPWTVHVNITQ